MVRVTRSQYAKETQVLPVTSVAHDNEANSSSAEAKQRVKSVKVEKTKNAEQTSTDHYLEVWNTIKKHKDKRYSSDTSLFRSRQEISLHVTYLINRGRRIARLFTSLPDKKRYPDYYEEIKKPISLEIIKKKIERNDYQDERELKVDLELMFENAKRYNVEGSQIYNDAVELQILSRQLLGGGADDVLMDEASTPNFVNEIEHKDEVYRIGEYVHIVNERNPSKPNVGLIFNIWTESRKSFVKICWYYRAEQTKHQASKKFFKDEVFKTNTFQDHPIEDVIEKCYVLQVKDYVTGRPKNSEGKMVYICESRYSEHGNTFSKIRNWLGCLPRDSPVIKIELERFETPLVLRKIGSPLTAAAHANEEEEEEESPRSTMSDIEPEEPEIDSVQTSETESAYSSPTGKRSAQTKTTPNRLASLRTRSSRRQPPSYNSNNPADAVSAAASPRTQHPHHYSPYPIVHPPYQMATMNPMMYGGFHDSGISTHYGYAYPVPYQHSQSHVMMPTPQYSHPQHYPVMTPPVQPNMTQIPMQTDDLSGRQRQSTPGIPKNNHPSVELPPETAEHFVRDENGKVLWFATPPIDVTPLPQPMHSIEYLHRYDEIRARNKLRMQGEISNQENQKNGVKKQTTMKLNSVQESELIDTIREISNGWKEDAIALKARLDDRS
ncbi:6105_t:CDS:10 [Acaulospora colombiana]|uniref:6105_t:CDS:1 n=1 Tax=Acaulospora colombiana TaxID=27376 RepID=A0ACA9LNK7_9GLOM|nr:6105_t:CDS:10 [Acaulospora colombiana]